MKKTFKAGEKVIITGGNHLIRGQVAIVLSNAYDKKFEIIEDTYVVASPNNLGKSEDEYQEVKAYDLEHFQE